VARHRSYSRILDEQALFFDTSVKEPLAGACAVSSTGAGAAGHRADALALPRSGCADRHVAGAVAVEIADEGHGVAELVAVGRAGPRAQRASVASREQPHRASQAPERGPLAHASDEQVRSSVAVHIGAARQSVPEASVAHRAGLIEQRGAVGAAEHDETSAVLERGVVEHAARHEVGTSVAVDVAARR
jgi:hypothetical protein